MPRTKPALTKKLLATDSHPDSAAAESHEPALRAGPMALRPDPATLFTRTSVATVALAMMLTGDASAQAPAATPAPKRPSTGTATAEMPEVVVRGQQDEPGAYRASAVSNAQYTE